MAFRRVIFTSDKLADVKKDVERFFSLPKFKTDFPGLKTTIKPGAKSDVLVVDVNGEGADSVSRKLKDIGIKFKATVKVRNEIKTTPIKENKDNIDNEFISLIKSFHTESSTKQFINRCIEEWNRVPKDKKHIVLNDLKSLLKQHSNKITQALTIIKNYSSLKEEKIVKVKQLIKEEVRKILSEQEYEFGQFFTKEDEKAVYKELMVPYKGKLEYVFIWFRELVKRGKVKFIPEIKPYKNNTEEDEKNYTQSHILDYYDEDTGEVFTVTVLDEDWYESVRNIYPENKDSLEIMKRENLIK